MITVASYIALQYYIGTSFSGWLLVLPVFTDFALIALIEGVWK